MPSSRASSDELGGILAMVKPNPVSVLIGCIPGAAMLFAMLSRGGLRDLFLVFDPAIRFPAGAREFILIFTALSLFVLWLGLRHFFDRAELCQNGFRFRGKAYRYDQIGPISWSHNANNLTRFADYTTMSFSYQGKQVRLRTRYLQDLSYQFHRVYAVDPVSGAAASTGGVSYTNTAHHPRAN